MSVKAYLLRVMWSIPLGIVLTAFLGWYGLYNHVFQINDVVSSNVFALCFALAFGTIAPLAISLKFGFRPAGMVNEYFGLNSATICLFVVSVGWILVLAGIFNYLGPFSFVGY